MMVEYRQCYMKGCADNIQHGNHNKHDKQKMEEVEMIHGQYNGIIG